ncbi:hypothetical protein [Mycolicibacterium iranicum]|uniref:PE-PPE domain-containing protein n=1 Tax=Mycolicibacterium iranicum TaxID=912594 RepID=A0A178LBV2_MYCIR|nr:hypothetical protein [Mycolicibacterium iranicum]OAN26383.1 hypothetical protein A4X20_12030 [Mycolicibacterium iranicum]
MRVAVKPVITTSVALVGASVIAVTPIQAPAPTVRVIESDVSLSASSVAYVPVNMIQHALSAPANMVAALDRLAAAMVISGSWNENHANNQWGWDEANPAMLKEMVNTLIPFPALSEPLGRHLNWWATANLPMYEGCNYDCPDLAGMLGRMFKVPMSEFYDEDGYTFPEVRTPFNGEETPWSNETVKLDPAEPLQALWDSLTAEPTGIKTTTLWAMVTAVANFSAAMQVTGHMPDWVAVREIETFVKLFLRPPADEATEEPETSSQTPALALVADAAPDEVLGDPSPVSALRSFGTQAADDLVDVDDARVADAAAESAEAEENSDTEASAEPSATSIVDSATSYLRGKFAHSQQDSAPASDAADSTDEADAAEADAAEDADANDDSDAGRDDRTGDAKTAGSGGSASDNETGSDDSDSGDSGSSGSGGGES